MYSFTDGLGWMIVSASIIGFGFGFCNPAMSAQMLDEAAPQDQNIAVGGFQFGYNLGMIVSTPVMGVVTEAFGYQVMFRAAAGMAVLSMAIYVIGELTRKPRPAEK
jgi:predicted MFS family arabinose efflux permease